MTTASSELSSEVPDKDGAGGTHPKPFLNLEMWLLPALLGVDAFPKILRKKTPRKSIQAAPQCHLLLLSGPEVNKSFLLVLLGVHLKKYKYTLTNVA